MKALCVTALMTALWAPFAMAASGYVRGSATFYQNQGNYCDPDLSSCVGAHYTVDEWHTLQPLPSTYLFIADANGTVLGSGYTSESGMYVIHWSSSPSAPLTAQLHWRARHASGAFEITACDGMSYDFLGPAFTLQDGTTMERPQVLEAWSLGAEDAPEPIANTYDGARMTWANALSLSSKMVVRFTDLDILAFACLGDTCADSCADTDQTRIYLDAEAAYRPQWRVMHEMGHMAIYLSNPYQGTFSDRDTWMGRDIYGYLPDDGCVACGTDCAGVYGCRGDLFCRGWYPWTQEHLMVTFEEGLASFIADAGLYAQTATAPWTCNFEGACELCSGWPLDDRLSVDGMSCLPYEQRTPVSAERYFWDLYDAQDDPPAFRAGVTPGSVAGEEDVDDPHSYPFHVFLDALDEYPPGTADGELNEVWNEQYTALDDLDGRNAADFQRHFDALTGADTQALRIANCQDAP